MAIAYIDALKDKLDFRGGALIEDVNYSEAWEFHRRVFNDHGLTVEAWTLHSVLSVITENTREAYWKKVLESAGDLPGELNLAIQTGQLMALASAISTPANRELAKRWVGRVDSPSGGGTVAKSILNQIINMISGAFSSGSTDSSDKSGSTLIDININPAPQPQQTIQHENQTRQDVSNGFAVNSPTHSISFKDGLLNKTDFTSTQMGSLATGGIRPGEIQRDPNARPNSYLSQFYLDRPTSSKPDYGLLNAVTLNGLAAMTTVNTYVDPLLLDLTGNGVRMTDLGDGVLFDTDHSGTLKRTGWANRSTGMLVVDDGTGHIKNVSQMFSEYYAGKHGVGGAAGEARFKDGFAALASEDSNADGVIDRNDPIWNRLRVWVDASHDAKTDAGELKTLAELGITQINVRDKNASTEVRDGNRVLVEGTFTIKGKIQEALAVDFLGEPVSSTLLAHASGTQVISTSEGSTTSAYASHSVTGETLDATQLGVNNLYGGEGDDTLNAATTGSWLVGGEAAMFTTVQPVTMFL
ncbi:hypothetical protein [Pseudomonas fragi]|uniref:hypothetical protein n=1 Tax=Pseudomonas fragi TaxID=296 RepID=UPI0012F7F4B3|nr:hypothetical protein [Pseudomonas fragi]